MSVLFRHRLTSHSASSEANTPSSSTNGLPRNSPAPAHGASHVSSSSTGPVGSNPSQTRPDNDKEDPVDYRCFNNTKSEPRDQSEDYSASRNGHSGPGSTASAQDLVMDEDSRFSTDSRTQQPTSNTQTQLSRRGSLVFRPESAPTVLDMSPEGSLSGPPTSVRSNHDLIDGHRHASTNGEEPEHSVSLGEGDFGN